MDREDQGAPNQRGSIAPFLLMAAVLFLLTNHGGEEALSRFQYKEAIDSLTYQRSNYTAWINGTDSNFTMLPFEETLPPLVHAFGASGSPVDPWKDSRYSNVTGFLRGDATYHNITPSFVSYNVSEDKWRPFARVFMHDVNETDVMASLKGWWNWTASTRVALNLVEKTPVQWSVEGEELMLVHGRIELTDTATEEDLRFEFDGIHAIKNGSIYGMAEPTGRHVDIRMLPSLLPPVYQKETARAIVKELSSKITKLEELIDAGTDVSQEEPATKSNCPFIFRGKIESTGIPQAKMTELEQEMENPTGLWTVPPPTMSLSGVFISKECGILFEITNTEGLRTYVFLRRVITYSGAAAFFYLALLILLQRQVQVSGTPSGIPRVSRWTFLTQGVVDSLSFASHITFAILADGRTSLALLAPAFLACILFVTETRFALLLQHVQIPEHVPAPASAPTTMATPPATPPTPTATATPASVLPTTASPPAPTAPASPSPRLRFVRDFLRHLLTDPQARIWLGMVTSIALLVCILMTPWLGVLVFAVTYSSFWMPQIVRSTRRGRSSGLTVEYLVGTTVCRLFFALYFLAYPDNVLDVDPRPWAYLLAVFVFAQVAVVVLQDRLGPTFFLPSHYTSTRTTYNYHPSMPLPDPEAPEQSLGDCAICMDAIVLERDPKAGGEMNERLMYAVTTSSGGGRKVYSLAPCHHLFHTDCLERWLGIKNICPQCRRPLPPL